MKRFFIWFIVVVVFASCEKDQQVEIPDTSWDLFESAHTHLTGEEMQRIEGVYLCGAGNDEFGTRAVFHFSFSAVGTDTTFYLSAFSPDDIRYILLEGRRIDELIILNGYWRKMTGTATGLARFTILPDQGGSGVINNSVISSIRIEGVYGFSDEVPVRPLSFSFVSPLYTVTDLFVLAHRGGGRTSDHLPFSENSVEMIRFASQLGANGVEIDVKLTSDGIPILYHDNTLNERLIRENGMSGSIDQYSFLQLRNLVRLKNGERIPSLQEALHTIVYETPLEFVWLDVKFDGSLQLIRDLQSAYEDIADGLGRRISIVIGVPDEDVMHQFFGLPNFQSIPSICELGISEFDRLGSSFWAPKWTEGLLTSEVNRIHAQGKKAIAWTMDIPQYMRQFIMESGFDGYLTNYSPGLAYYHYAR